MGTTERDRAQSSVRVEHGAKRIRAYLGGELVADTTRPLLVWEVPQYPTYYFPADDVRAELLHADGAVAHSASRGDGERFTVRAGGREARGAAERYESAVIDPRQATIRLQWQAMDAWFEEDEEVFTHARDPHTRVDILASSRHLRVEIDGTAIAESTSPRLLFETGLPVRFYVPKTHVRMDLLQLSDKVTHCPYKGDANYYTVPIGGSKSVNAVWTYEAPFAAVAEIEGHVAFYPDRVDAIAEQEPV